MAEGVLPAPSHCTRGLVMPPLTPHLVILVTTLPRMDQSLCSAPWKFARSKEGRILLGFCQHRKLSPSPHATLVQYMRSVGGMRETRTEGVSHVACPAVVPAAFPSHSCVLFSKKRR